MILTDVQCRMMAYLECTIIYANGEITISMKRHRRDDIAFGKFQLHFPQHPQRVAEVKEHPFGPSGPVVLKNYITHFTFSGTEEYANELKELLKTAKA